MRRCLVAGIVLRRPVFLLIVLLGVICTPITYRAASAIPITQSITFTGSSAANTPAGGTISYDDAAVTSTFSGAVPLTAVSISSPFHTWTLSDTLLVPPSISYISGVQSGLTINIMDITGPDVAIISLFPGGQWSLVDIGALFSLHQGSLNLSGTYTLAIVYSPEPGTFLTLVSGIAGLGLFYWYRETLQKRRARRFPGMLSK